MKELVVPLNKVKQKVWKMLMRGKGQTSSTFVFLSVCSMSPGQDYVFVQYILENTSSRKREMVPKR